VITTPSHTGTKKGFIQGFTEEKLHIAPLNNLCYRIYNYDWPFPYTLTNP